MDSEVWRNLPKELLERTLSFLSTPALCRLRTVCRGWNNLICDPGFLHRATQEYVVARWTIKGSVLDLLAYKDGYIDYEDNQGYSILDVHSKRWYTIPCIDSPAYYMIPSDNVAMDGGLVCYILEDHLGNFVSLTNPVGYEPRRLPSLPLGYKGGDFKVDMAVTGRACTILLMSGPDTLKVPKPMLTYDTRSDRWREAADLPSLPTGEESCVACSVVFRGSLYALLLSKSRLDATEHWLWRYDAWTSWSDTGVAILGCVLADPKLMASGDSRMLLAAWKQSSSGESIYVVSEVHLERRVVEAVASVDVERMFGVADRKSKMDSAHAVSMGERVVVVWKPSGAVRIYDLRTGEWDESVPDHPAVEGSTAFRTWYGKAMHLKLPSSTSWIHESGDGASASNSCNLQLD